MKIAEIRSIPLVGRAPDQGWESEIAPDETMHTLVEVVTDAGLVGLGSCSTSQALVVCILVERARHALQPFRGKPELFRVAACQRLRVQLGGGEQQTGEDASKCSHGKSIQEQSTNASPGTSGQIAVSPCCSTVYGPTPAAIHPACPAVRPTTPTRSSSRPSN